MARPVSNMTRAGEIGGMAELIADLQAMGEEVKALAAEIIDDTAEEMAAELKQTYPKREGVLRNSVVIDRSLNSALKTKVRSRAQHAHLYEYGTVQRFTADKGANRGTMPARPTVIPIAQRHRARMMDRLVDLVEARKVRGMTGTLTVRTSGIGGRFL